MKEDEKFTLPIYIDEDLEAEPDPESEFQFEYLEVEPIGNDDGNMIGMSIGQGNKEIYISIRQFEDLKRQWKYYCSLRNRGLTS